MAAKTAFEAVPTMLSLTVVLQICGNGLRVCGLGFQVFGAFDVEKEGRKWRLAAAE
jgi:hypothetical protein